MLRVFLIDDRFFNSNSMPFLTQIELTTIHDIKDKNTRTGHGICENIKSDSEQECEWV